MLFFSQKLPFFRQKHKRAIYQRFLSLQKSSAVFLCFPFVAK